MLGKDVLTGVLDLALTLSVARGYLRQAPVETPQLPQGYAHFSPAPDGYHWRFVPCVEGQQFPNVPTRESRFCIARQLVPDTERETRRDKLIVGAKSPIDRRLSSR